MPSRNFVALVGHPQWQKHPRQFIDGLLPLTEGEIRLDGRPLSSLKSKRCARARNGAARSGGAGGTFLANVTLGRDISEERVWQALETV